MIVSAYNRSPSSLGWVIANLTVFALFFCLYAGVALSFYRLFPVTHSWTEMMINYQGGLVKRGLLGEIAFQVDGLISARRIVVGTLLGGYIAIIAGLISQTRISPLATFLLLMSPAGLLFAVLDPAAFGRKDVFILGAALASMLLIGRSLKDSYTFAALVTVFSVSSLVIEAVWFYFPLTFAGFIASRSSWSFRQQILYTAAAGATTLAGLMIAYAMGSADTAAIVSSWRAKYPASFPDIYPGHGALCCLGINISTALGNAYYTAIDGIRRDGYVVSWCLGLVPAVFLLSTQKLASLRPVTLCAFFAGVVAAIGPLMFASDWGRYIHLFCCTLFFALWPLRKDARQVTMADIVLIAIYAATWKFTHFSAPGTPSLLPGAIFNLVNG